MVTNKNLIFTCMNERYLKLPLTAVNNHSSMKQVEWTIKII
mgnify:CR=1 FL=1|jgi:hypothetical protein